MESPGTPLITFDGVSLGESIILPSSLKKFTVFSPSYMEIEPFGSSAPAPFSDVSLGRSLLPSTLWWDPERSKGQVTVLGAHLSLHWSEPVAVLTVRPCPVFHEYFRMFAGRILTVLCPPPCTCHPYSRVNRSFGGRKHHLSLSLLYYPKTCQLSCCMSKV